MVTGYLLIPHPELNMKTTLILSLFLSSALCQADLLYRFNYDGGGTGTTLTDLSGFGTADDAIMYDSTTPTNNRIASTVSTVSPDGGSYGNFATDDRRNLSSFGSKWNDGSTGVVATDAVTVTMLLRDVNLTGGTGSSPDGAIFRSDNNSNPLALTVTNTDESATTFRLQVAGSSADTTATADIQNSTGGNGWMLLAFSYSSATDIGRIYLGKEFNSTTGTWGSFGQIGSDLSISSTDIPSGDLGAATRFGFGSSSGSSQQFNGDDFRIYNEVLSESAIGDLYVIPEPSSIALMGLVLGIGLFLRKRVV